jgi:hypothetical protein
MKKFLLTTTAAGAAIAMAAPAAVAKDWYITGFGGINMLDDQGVSLDVHSFYGSTFSTSTVATSPTYVAFTHATFGYFTHFNGAVEFDNGFVIGAALGTECDCLPGWSLEGELAYRKNDLDAVGMVSFGYYVNKYSEVQNSTGLTVVQYTKNAHILLQTSFTSSSIDYTYFVGPTATSIGGDITAFSIMANVWYEFQMD